MSSPRSQDCPLHGLASWCWKADTPHPMKHITDWFTNPRPMLCCLLQSMALQHCSNEMSHTGLLDEKSQWSGCLFPASTKLVLLTLIPVCALCLLHIWLEDVHGEIEATIHFS